MPAGPAARNPAAVRRSTVTPGRPVVDRSVQTAPLPLVQIESGPSATQPPAPPAISRGACPGGGAPPVAPDSGARDQSIPASRLMKNSALGSTVPVSAPTATTSGPSLATRPSSRVTPRLDKSAAKSWPASVAGGKPRVVALPGAAPPPAPLFAPVTTTTATPTAVIAAIGTATRNAQPRNRRLARKR